MFWLLFWPDDGCLAAETCCLDDNYRVLYITIDIIL